MHPHRSNRVVTFWRILPRAPPARARGRDMSAAELEAQEQAMFTKWIDDIFAKYKRADLNYFEHNLEVRRPRRLWRARALTRAHWRTSSLASAPIGASARLSTLRGSWGRQTSAARQLGAAGRSRAAPRKA